MVNFAKKVTLCQLVHRENGAKRYVFSAYNDVFNFLNWIYADANIYLERKYEAYKNFLLNGKNMQ